MIRPYTADDLDSVLDVWYQASLVAHLFLTEEFLTQERQQIAEHWLPMARTTVYETDGRVVGFLALIGNEVERSSSTPAIKDEGWAGPSWTVPRGSRPFLELDVFEANAIGWRFHDRYGYGFEVVDRHIPEATGQPELRLRLDSPGCPLQ